MIRRRQRPATTPVSEETMRFSRPVLNKACLIALVAALVLVAESAAGQGMRGAWAPDIGHMSRSVAHWIGILGGLAIIYFSLSVRRNMGGSPVANCGLLVGVGTALFVLVFLDMEAGHLLGRGLWSATVSNEIAQLWWMTALAAMITLYTVSYRELVVGVGSGSRRGTATDRRTLAGLSGGIIAGFAVLGIIGAVGGAVLLDGARSAAHVLGFGFSLLLAYYANRAWQQFRGGVYATTASYTLAGAVVFAVAFAVVEIRHDFGVDLLTAVNGMQLKMAVSMVLFTSTVFAFGWAYFRLARALDRA